MWSNIIFYTMRVKCTTESSRTRFLFKNSNMLDIFIFLKKICQRNSGKTTTQYDKLHNNSYLTLFASLNFKPKIFITLNPFMFFI